jgi:hypothetical protein
MPFLVNYLAMTRHTESKGREFRTEGQTEQGLQTPPNKTITTNQNIGSPSLSLSLSERNERGKKMADEDEAMPPIGGCPGMPPGAARAGHQQRQSLLLLPSRKRARGSGESGGKEGATEERGEAQAGEDANLEDEDYDGDEEEEEEEGAVPVYNGRKDARRVFANAFFYHGKKSAAEAYAGERRGAIAEGQKVRDVRRAREGRDDGFAEFADEIGASTSLVEKYFAREGATLERLLADEVLPVALNAAGELDVYRDRGALSIDTLTSTYQDRGPGPGPGGASAGQHPGRSMPLAVVTGGSGSGKTFFCLKYLADFLRREQYLAAATTLYLRPDPKVTKVSFLERPIDEICQGLLAYIRRRVENKFSKFGRKVKGRLNMHVCVIFDEAGAPDLGGRFEDKAFLEELCTHLQLHLADSVGVVVSGTGITGKSLTSAGDAYIFRLKPWEPNDVKALFEQRRRDVVLTDGDTLQDVVDAIFGHPKLRGLTTNARSAFLLREAIIAQCSSHVTDSWTVQLDAWAPALVTQVVRGYIEGNGIRDLGFGERRVVAASVFRALEDAASWKPDSGELVFNPPPFEGLDGTLLAVARSLVTWNVELVGAKAGHGKVLRLVEGERRVISVTPAVATVLFVMVGVQVSMIRGWRAEEEVAALYAARQVILRSFDSFRANRENLQEELRKVRLYELRKPIQPFREATATPSAVVGAQAKERQVRVPIVSPSTVLLMETRPPSRTSLHRTCCFKRNIRPASE